MDIAIAGAYAIYRFMERTAERVSNGVRWETIKDMMMRLFGWLIVAIALSGPNNLCAASEIDTLVVLHTNDFHGYISPDGDRTAGLARIAAYFNHERARGANVLAIDGGDCVSGTPVSILFKGRPIFEAMSVAGYDAAERISVSKREAITSDALQRNHGVVWRFSPFYRVHHP